MSEKECAFYKPLGERIKQARVEAGITQKQLAEELDVAQPMMNKYENGTRRIPAMYLPDICKILKISSDTLLGVA